MDADAVRSAAAALFVDCFPLVLTDVVRSHHPVGAHQFRLLTSDPGALAPGLDEQDELMVVTSAWLDLSNGPVVINLPHTGGRFFSLTLIDTVGEPFASLGTRTRDDAGLCLALVGPRWEGELPSGLRAKRAPGVHVWALGRIRAYSAIDFPETTAIAQRQGLAALKLHPSIPEPIVSAAESPWPPSLRQVVEMEPAMFFHRLEGILDRARLTRQKSSRIAALKAELGGPPEATDWNAGFAAALAGGFADAVEAIGSSAASRGQPGWREFGGGSSDAGADGLTQAAHAYASLGASLRKDVLTLGCDRDATGLPLVGEKHYRLRFARGALPPAHAFWRLSAMPPARYDRRRGIGDRSDPALNEDGSLDIVLQRSPPDAALLSNWLPLPDGRLSLLMRLFSPAEPALDGAWSLPAPERVPTGHGDRPTPDAPPAPEERAGAPI